MKGGGAPEQADYGGDSVQGWGGGEILERYTWIMNLQRRFPSSAPGGAPASRRSCRHVKAGILRGYRDIESNSTRRTPSHQVFALSSPIAVASPRCK